MKLNKISPDLYDGEYKGIQFSIVRDRGHGIDVGYGTKSMWYFQK